MTIRRMDNVGIVVEDLDAAVAFLAELGMELEGRAEVEGPWADRTVGLDGVRCAIAMMRTPDGHSRLELAKYLAPAAVPSQPRRPPHNTVGMHRVMFAVDDIRDTVDRLRPHGGEVVDEVTVRGRIPAVLSARPRRDPRRPCAGDRVRPGGRGWS